MGTICSKSVAFVDKTDHSNTRFDYLKPKDKICCCHNCGHYVLILYRDFEGWKTVHHCLWPDGKC